MRLTHKQETFCIALAHCGDVLEAYRRAYATDGLSPRAVEGRARALLAKDAVAARLDALRAAATAPVAPSPAHAKAVSGTAVSATTTNATAVNPASAVPAPGGVGTFTLEAHIAKLEELRDLALEAEKYGSAIQAEISRGRAAGFYTERLRTEVSGPGGGAVQEELVITFVRAQHD